MGHTKTDDELDLAHEKKLANLYSKSLRSIRLCNVLSSFLRIQDVLLVPRNAFMRL